MATETRNPAGQGQGFMGGAMQIFKRSLAKIFLTVKLFLARWSWLVGTWS